MEGLCLPSIGHYHYDDNSFIFEQMSCWFEGAMLHLISD